MNSAQLAKLCYVTPRTENDPEEIQRLLDKRRVKEIGLYIKEETSLLPNAIVIALSEVVRIVETDSDNEVFIEFPDKTGKFAYILDGQHRIAGFEYADGKQFDLPVVALHNPDLSTRGRVFADINSKQVKVTDSQLLSLYYQIRELPKDDTEIMDIIKSLNDDMDSPLRGKIQMMPSEKSRWIKNVAMMKYLKPIVVQGGPLCRKKTTEKVKILKEYFGAISQVWDTAWDSPKTHTLCKSMGFDIMLGIFDNIKQQVDLKHGQLYVKDNFFKILINLKNYTLKMPGGGEIELNWEKGALATVSNAPGIKMVKILLKEALHS
jgi:DGQHR domain-containing protein